VNQARPELEETSDELRGLIAEHNQLDAELYRFARKRFEEESPSSEDLAADAEELRRLSIRVTAEGDAYAAGKKDRVAAKKAARETRRAAARAERADQPKTEKKKKADRPRKPRTKQKRGGGDGGEAQPASGLT
jgi:hypothetical protein